MCKRLPVFMAFMSLYFGTLPTLAQTDMKKLIRTNLELAARQYRHMASLVPADSMPRSFDPKHGVLLNSDTKWWCSGFYPGTLWLIYEYTKDPVIRQEAERKLSILEKEKHFKSNHDLGFMIYCSFGTAYRITGNPAYKPTIDTAAMSLATRWRPSIKSIQSWDSSKNFKCAVIIDNMMNLELLYWVSEQGGDPRFRDIAIAHANTTMERQFRPDNSSIHVLDYSLATGKLEREATWQGYAPASAWSRGQAWGLYGYTTMYRFSRDKKYLDQARKIADFILQHPRMPKDMVPYWDYDAPNIPDAVRDASAASITASALLELSRYTEKKESRRYIRAAEKMLRTLSSSDYLSKPGENGGFLLKHSTGAFPLHSEIDHSITYADYYFVEALLRYRDWVIK